MIPLRSLSLQNFRSYAQHSLDFTEQVACIVGPNGSGKTSIIEAISLLATGESFRARKTTEMISFAAELARVRGVIEESDSECIELEVLLTHGVLQGKATPRRLFRVNGVPRQRRVATNRFYTTVFRPEDLRLIEGSPSRRREFLDTVLKAVHPEYERSLKTYEQTLRRRNKLLEQVRSGEQPARVLSYWDITLLKHGKVLQQFRQEFVASCSLVSFPKKFSITYNPSILSLERQEEYKARSIAAGHTLIGPHKDDFAVTLHTPTNNLELSAFASRGQQRLGVLWLKLCEHEYIRSSVTRPQLLLLDDIWSELDQDSQHIIEPLFLEQQTILTTTSKELAHSTPGQKIELTVE